MEGGELGMMTSRTTAVTELFASAGRVMCRGRMIVPDDEVAHIQHKETDRMARVHEHGKRLRDEDSGDDPACQREGER